MLNPFLSFSASVVISQLVTEYSIQFDPIRPPPLRGVNAPGGTSEREVRGLTSMVWDAFMRVSHLSTSYMFREFMAECMVEHHAHGNKDAQRPKTRHTGMHAPNYPP